MNYFSRTIILIFVSFIPKFAYASDMSGLFYFFAFIALFPFMLFGPAFGLLAYKLVPEGSDKAVINASVIGGFIVGYIVSYLITLFLLIGL